VTVLGAALRIEVEIAAPLGLYAQGDAQLWLAPFQGDVPDVRLGSVGITGAAGWSGGFRAGF
jgi:putative methionine-R-sulfoxide reductase with GAF domain